MHVTPVPPDTDHSDHPSVIVREVASMMSAHLKDGFTLASLIDWKTQERKFQFYRRNSEGRHRLVHEIQILETVDVESTFQTVLSDAVQNGCANPEVHRKVFNPRSDYNSIEV